MSKNESKTVEYSEDRELKINPEAVERHYDNLRIRPTQRNGAVVEHRNAPLNLSVRGIKGYTVGIDVREEDLDEKELEDLEEYLVDEDGIGASKLLSELYVFNADVGSPEEVEEILDKIDGLEGEGRYRNVG